MAAPTIEEIPILQEFRKEIADLELGKEKQTDIALLSWLRARDLDISNASEMLRKSMEWREINDIDNILDWSPPSNYKTEYDYEICGSDKEGRPICVVPFGVWDVRKVVNSGQRATWLRYFDLMMAQNFTKMQEASERLEKEVTQLVFIYDFANLPMRQITSFSSVDSILEFVRRLEANYPETIYKIYIVNGKGIWMDTIDHGSAVQPLLSARTLAKIEIYSSPAKWKPVLQRDLPTDQLPMELGGTRRLGRRVSIGNAPYVDQGLAEGLDFISVNVGAGQKLDLEFSVQQQNTKIKWTFKTAAGVIGFSISRDRKDEVLGYKIYDSHLSQEAGEITCDKLGDYFLTFDNTYSNLRENTLHYLVELVDPVSVELEDDIAEADESPAIAIR